MKRNLGDSKRSKKKIRNFFEENGSRRPSIGSRARNADYQRRAEEFAQHHVVGISQEAAQAVWNFVVTVTHLLSGVLAFVERLLQHILKVLHFPAACLGLGYLSLKYGHLLALLIPLHFPGTWLNKIDVGVWGNLSKWLLFGASFIAAWCAYKQHLQLSDLRRRCLITYERYLHRISLPGSALFDFIGAYFFGISLVGIALTIAVGGALAISAHFTKEPVLGVVLAILSSFFTMTIGGAFATAWRTMLQPYGLMRLWRDSGEILRRLHEDEEEEN
jgi:hypothetical protein